MYFADKQTRGMPPRFADRALAVLKAYHWPGNVRELENVVQRALVLSQGEALVDVEHFALGTGARTAPASGLAGGLWEEEARRIVDALQVCRGSRKDAATQLGISARTLRYKLAKMRDTGVAVPGDNRTAT
jgi:two-component system response regulator FlrC